MTCYKGEETAYLIVITDLTQLIKVNSALVRYTSPDIADFVLTTEEGQKSGGKNKEVTVIMSRHAHDGSGTVISQYIIGKPDFYRAGKL